MYGKCGDLPEARLLFDNMARRNVFSWTIMIAAYAQKGHGKEALQLFQEMQAVRVKPDKFTFTTILGVCSKLVALEQGKEIHTSIVESGFYSDVVVKTALMNMYNKCGNVEEARKVFDDMPERDAISWNTMISAYVQNGHSSLALKLYRKMQAEQVKPDKVTFLTALGACSTPSDLCQGKGIHADIDASGFDSDTVVMTALFHMYGKCGSVEGARMLFDKMHGRDLVSWNAMITTYVQYGQVKEALELYAEMQQLGVKANRITYLSVLGACSSPTALAEGKKIHESIAKDTGFQPDIVVNTSLVNMYSRCGDLEKARKLFNQMQGRDTVSWNAIILEYVHHGHYKEALQLYQQMQREGLEPDGTTFKGVLTAFSSLAALSRGKKVPTSIADTDFETDVSIGTALFNMYSMCGSLEVIQSVLDKMQKGNIGWNAMIAAYAQNKKGVEAMCLFRRMQHEHVKPDKDTFVNILNACIWSGLADDAWHYFSMMTEQADMTPTVEHCACMVDLLGRSGQLEEAERFIANIPIQANAAVWKALLAACRIHGDVDRGKRVAEYVIQMDPQNAAPYILLSNMYARDRRWDDVEQVRRAMVDNGAEMQVAFSTIEINNMVHKFGVNDRSHPQSDDIYAEFERLSSLMKERGYKPGDSKLMFHDVEEELVENTISHHSEMLAIAFGLITTTPGETLRVVKNLRMCPDCHGSIKFISKMVDQKIIVWDSSCFHHFKDGECLCGDYW